MSLGMWKRGKALSIASITSKKDLRERMVTRIPSNLVVLVCAETFTELSVLVIGMYLSFEFQFGFRVAFRLARKRAADRRDLCDRNMDGSKCRFGRVLATIIPTASMLLPRIGPIAMRSLARAT